MNAARHAVGDNGEQQRLIRTIPRKGFRFVGEVREGEQAPDTKAEPAASIKPRELSAVADKQSVTFCRTQDSANIAVASIGSGPTLVRTPFLITHIEYDWQHPFMAPLMRRLAQGRRVVRYDGRGTGMSGRNVPEITPRPSCSTLKLWSPPSTLNASPCSECRAASPPRSHMPRGIRSACRGWFSMEAMRKAATSAAPPNTPRRRRLLHDAAKRMGRRTIAILAGIQLVLFAEWHARGTRMAHAISPAAASTEDSLKLRRAVDDIDVLDLASKVSAPTIVFHCLRDTLVPFEQARLLAASIPGARLVALDSENQFLRRMIQPGRSSLARWKLS